MVVTMNGRMVSHLPETGSSQDRPCTHTLYVSENGDNTTGLSWGTAFTTIQGALAVASTNADDITLILIAPNDTHYDIYTTGDPTYSGNYVLKGVRRNWAKIKNTHASATSVMKFTGKVALIDLNINLGTANDGIIITSGGFYLDHCMFVGEDLAGAHTGLKIDGGGTTTKHGEVRDCYFRGEGTYFSGILLNNASCHYITDVRIGFGATGIQITNAGSDYNKFENVDICSLTIGMDIDAGNSQFLVNVYFENCTTNIDDEVGDHTIRELHGSFDVSISPDDFTGVDLNTDGAANTWGSDTEILSAASRTSPFMIKNIDVEADANEKFRVRLSDDSGSTHFVDVQVEGTNAAAKRESLNFGAESTKVFNKGTRISGSAKSESGGDTATVWLEIQEI